METPSSRRWAIHRARVEAGAGDGFHVEPAILAAVEQRDFLAKVQRRIEGRDLLHEPVDELLGAANRQRRNVVDRLVGIQFRALPARRTQGVDQVAADSQKSELEYLEQPARAGADDHDFGDDRRLRGDLGQTRILGARQGAQ